MSAGDFASYISDHIVYIYTRSTNFPLQFISNYVTTQSIFILQIFYCVMVLRFVINVSKHSIQCDKITAVTHLDIVALIVLNTFKPSRKESIPS